MIDADDVRIARIRVADGGSFAANQTGHNAFCHHVFEDSTYASQNHLYARLTCTSQHDLEAPAGSDQTNKGIDLAVPPRRPIMSRSRESPL
jgi:hypothetical protein